MKKKLKKRIGNIFLSLFSCFFILLGVFSIVICMRIQNRFETNPDLSAYRSLVNRTEPKFYAYDFENREERTGQKTEVFENASTRNFYEYIPLSKISKETQEAFISIEDKRFFKHRGVDWIRTCSAGIQYVFGKGKNFGGSGITQQLVKNVSGNNEVSVSRKMQEILTARALEREFGKDEILEKYLNVISFSDGCYGICAAAKHYYSKEVCDLTIAEAASIAAITNNPSYYNPIRHPEHNKQRRDLILTEMYHQGYLSSTEFENATESSIQLCITPINTANIHSWYYDMVTEDVISDLSKQLNLSRSAASNLFYRGGLQIEVAMDEEIQNMVEDYYRAAIKLPKNKSGVSAQSSLIILNSKTGDILAVAGAAGKKEGNRIQNYATQTLRPPGSALKPISVYAPALEQGLITWSSVYDDVPVDFGTQNDRPWPKNASNGYRGLTNIAYAVAHSTNTVAVKVLEDLGIETSFDYATNAFHLPLLQGKDKSDQGLAALALGQLNYGVTLRDLTTAYTAFSDAGNYHPYRSYYRVLDSENQVLISKADASEKALSPSNAAIMTKLLQGVIEYGSSSSITLDRYTECAGKTGTTQNDSDRWFIGYTPELVCGVWCGYEYPEPVGGKNPCLTIWNQIMQNIVKSRNYESIFEVPADVIRVSYCKDSGLLESDACKYDPRGERQEVGWFRLGTEPKGHCHTHVLCKYDKISGGMIQTEGIFESVGDCALIRVLRKFPVQVTVEDAQYVYGGNPFLLPQNPNSELAYFDRESTVFYGKSNTKLPFNRSAPTRKEEEENTLLPHIRSFWRILFR